MTSNSSKRRPPPSTTKNVPNRTSTGASGRRGGSLVGIALAALAVVGLLTWLAVRGEPAAPQNAAFVGGDFHSLVADPNEPDTLYVGGHEAVSRSTDAGATWDRIDRLDGADAMGWGFTDDTIYVSGHPGLTTAESGLASFVRTNDALPGTDLHALGAGGGTIYAAGPDAGVIASTDGGASWETRSTAYGQPFFGRILVDDDATTLTANDTQQGPLRSTDGGRSWTPLEGPPGVWVTRTSDDTIIVSGPQGSFRSNADETAWVPLAIPDGAQLVEADPHTPERLFAGGHDGSNVDLWVSTDSGRTWEPT